MDGYTTSEWPTAQPEKKRRIEMLKERPDRERQVSVQVLVCGGSRRGMTYDQRETR